jgi:catechol 2,3-dioxygenase-like lactoylglutathione lyase family enzyme
VNRVTQIVNYQNQSFDGVDPVTLCTPEAAQAVALYRDGLGFQVVQDLDWPAEPWRELWKLPEGGDMHVVELRKPRAHGGGIRIVHVPELPPVAGGRLPIQPGAFAWDFYVRDMAEAVERIKDLGWTFRSEPQRYPLFGQNFEVNEVMLEGPQGLLHALVEYIPGQHRCVLGVDENEDTSELIALVVVVTEVDAPREAMVSGLGADVAMDETFSGSEVERLLSLPSGSAFRMVLMRGPSRRSARFELLESIGGASTNPGIPHVIAPMPVPDLKRAIDQLRAHGIKAADPIRTGASFVAMAELAPGILIELR